MTASLIRDVFICHASVDKEHIVRPLARALDQAGITCWLDEGEIRWGDDITAKVNEGLKNSRYAIVVLSESFSSRHWPQVEMSAALSIELSTGVTRVLPLLAGDDEAVEKIGNDFPLLRAKRHLLWKHGISPIVMELNLLLGRKSIAHTVDAARPESITIPMPKIKHSFTDRDKHKFLDRAYEVIEGYFRQALAQLEQFDQHFETALKKEGDAAFKCIIYKNGEVKQECRVWIGGFGRLSQIAYAEGQNIDSRIGSSMNDWLSVETSDDGIYLKPSGMGFSMEKGELTPEQGAEYLWKRFTQYL